MDTQRWQGKAARPVAVRGARSCRWDYCHTPASNRIASWTGPAVFECPEFTDLPGGARIRGLAVSISRRKRQQRAVSSAG